MDVLEDMVTPPKFAEPEKDLRGRPNELKTYLLENNGDLESTFSFEGLAGDIKSTGLDTLKILTLANRPRDPSKPFNPNSNYHVQFYLDLSHKRFLTLYTNFDSDKTKHVVDRFIGSDKMELDHAWLSTSMLKRIAGATGNRRAGYRIGFRDYFLSPQTDELVDENDMFVEARGGISHSLFRLAEKDPTVQRALGYQWVGIARGENLLHGIQEEIGYDGRFMVRKGRSIGDHMILVNSVMDDYITQVSDVESLRLDGRLEEGFPTIEGTPFEFIFTREVSDWEPILSRMFDAKRPFRLWGMKSKVRDGFYQVLGVDMHTGHPVDIEVSGRLMRVYLPKYSCGNVVLRLFVNLQRFFDATMTCPQISAH